MFWSGSCYGFGARLRGAVLRVGYGSAVTEAGIRLYCYGSPGVAFRTARWRKPLCGAICRDLSQKLDISGRFVQKIRHGAW